MGNELTTKEAEQNHPQKPSSGFQESNQSQGQIPEYTHNLFKFDELVIDSRFDHGNLMLANKFASGKYDLWIAPDAYKTPYETKGAVWFYFKVSQVDLQGASSRTIHFKINNMKRSQYNNYVRQDMVPVYCSHAKGSVWQYLPTPLEGRKIVGPNLELKFSYTFDASESQQGVSFAFTFPYSYTDNINFLNYLENTYTSHPYIYFHRELLTYSHEGRRIDLLTITGHDPSLYDSNNPGELEPLLPNLFPTHPTHLTEPPTLNNRNIHRPFKFKNKKYVFFSTRVHPGEPPANYILQGLLLSLLNYDDPASQVSLQNFVFVIIPMLNPDGVYHGYARTDARGTNYQCKYHLADKKPKEYPGPYGVLEVAKSLNKDGNLVLYIDLHAHSNKNAGFIYGTWHEDFNARTDMRFFARMLDIYSKNFDYNECEFGLKKMVTEPDPDKMGVAKTEVRKQAGVLHAYTLETSFHISTKDPQRYSRDNSERLLNKSVIKRIGIYEYMEIGEGIKHAILETFLGYHPTSVLSNTFYENKENVKKHMMELMVQSKKQPSSERKESRGMQKGEQKNKSEEDI
jgi:hypothetical protein